MWMLTLVVDALAASLLVWLSWRLVVAWSELRDLQEAVVRLRAAHEADLARAVAGEPPMSTAEEDHHLRRLPEA